MFGAVLAATLAAAGGPAVWTLPALERIAPESPAGTITHASLEAAGGETASFQVAVKAPGGGLKGVRFSVSALRGQRGSIGGASIAAYREHFITIGHHSPVSYPLPSNPNLPLRERTFPDALIPFVDPLTGKPPGNAQYRAQPIELGANRDAAYWIDVSVPPGTAPGRYTGSYAVTSTSGSATGTVALDVLGFTVPAVPSLRTNFGSSHSGARTTGEDLELLWNKLMPYTVPLPLESQYIAQDGLGETDLGFSTGAYYGHCKMADPPSLGALRTAVAAQDPRLYLYDYSADEVERCKSDLGMLKAWARRLHGAGVPNLITVPPVPDLYDDGGGHGRSVVDIWTVLPIEYVAAQAFSPPRITYVLGKGDAVWFYTALVQDMYSPKWELDFDPVDYRIPGFIDASLGLTGTLYWSIDFWCNDPWTNVDYPGGCSDGKCYAFPGEGVLVYPGAEAGLQGVAPSLRLKEIRDGVQDYERFAMLSRCGYPADAQAIAQKAGGDGSWSTWTRDENTVYAASHALGVAIATKCGSRR